jgi:hypothetical protein
MLYINCLIDAKFLLAESIINVAWQLCQSEIAQVSLSGRKLPQRPQCQTTEQQNKMQEVFEVLYTTLAEIVEDHGALQSKYE